MNDRSAQILERFRTRYGKEIDLTLRAPYRDLLRALGDPQNKLPPVFHVAGTNGKGSTCAFLRAMLEAAGYKVHVYTSPHLVRFHERIRVAGQLIEEEPLADILAECETIAEPGTVSYFEAATAAAFAAFARAQADFTILEVGLGGRLDATNVVERPRATLITRLSFDHRDYLGDSIAQIAREKAGIMRPGVPCFAAAQPLPGARQALAEAAAQAGAVLHMGDADWRAEKTARGFRFTDAGRMLDLPMPALLGQHQIGNAGLAIAALADVPVAAIEKGLRSVDWPGRLQRISSGALTGLAPGCELWLDGGHNDSAGEVVAAQIEAWQAEDPKPLYVVLGMLTTKVPAEFLSPFAARIVALRTVPIEKESLAYSPAALAQEATKLGIVSAPALSVAEALRAAPQGARILICGSLYLAGQVLKENN